MSCEKAAGVVGCVALGVAIIGGAVALVVFAPAIGAASIIGAGTAGGYALLVGGGIVGGAVAVGGSIAVLSSAAVPSDPNVVDPAVAAAAEEANQQANAALVAAEDKNAALEQQLAEERARNESLERKVNGMERQMTVNHGHLTSDIQSLRQEVRETNDLVRGAVAQNTNGFHHQGRGPRGGDEWQNPLDGNYSSAGASRQSLH
jgi:hypothetical protein